MLKEIEDLWFKCYGENLKEEYSDFYKILSVLCERDKNTIKNQANIINIQQKLIKKLDKLIEIKSI